MMPMRKQIQTLHVPSGGHNHKMDLFNPRRQEEKVVIVMGATGTGKSRLSIDLATCFPAEIINSDKMQVYEGLDIVTNKITKEEQRGVPHHLLGILDPNEDFTARDFGDLTSHAIESVLGRNRLPIIVGGSNSYIEALVDDHVSVPVMHSFVSRRVDHMVQNGMVDEAKSSQSGSKGFSSYEHGTINIAYCWETFICVGVDSKLTDYLTGYVTNLNYNKFYQISRNIYITMAGFMMAWEEMFQVIASVFSTIAEESHTLELAANLAYWFISPYDPVGSLVLGWDNTSPHPQMFRVIAGRSLTTSDSAMTLGTGEQYINLRHLTDYYHGELAHAFQTTMLLLNQACVLDRFCGGVVTGRVLQRDQPPSCQYLNFFN